MKFKKRSSFKSVLTAAAAVTTSLILGMSAGCSAATPSTEEDENTSTKQDVQVIKNGNFEFYDDNDGLYPISSPDNWTSGSSGTASSSMSGIINTSKAGWDYLTDKTLPDTLEKNDDLSSSDESKKDYNGALTDDLPFKNMHTATESDPSDEDREYIANPYTHEYRYNAEGQIINNNGETVPTYANDGKTYLDADHTEELETSVLMLHNYRPSYYKGTEGYFTSSTTVTLEARTAAKISVWVKTAELYFDGAQNDRTQATNEHGAYIKIDTSVGGNSLDSFKIKNINTEELNPDGNNNGWVQYTVFVQASSFASTDVEMTLGLGENEIYTVEGYAFFDDAEIEIYDDEAAMIKAAEEELGDGQFGELITADNTVNLLDPDADGNFRVDKVSIKTNSSDGTLKDEVYEYNFGDRFFYIDLTGSENSDEAITLNESTVKAGFTVEKTTNGKFVCSKDGAKTEKVASLDNETGAANAYLPSGFKGVTTDNDLLATFEIGAQDWTFSAGGADYAYNNVLTEALKSAATLPGVNTSASAFVIMSANGAAYEAQINHSSFTLQPDKHVLITFWMKTSDMKGNTAATVTVEETGNKQDKLTNSFTLDTTTLDGVTINDREDVYDGWAECFVRVENTSDEEKTFDLKFNFGTTTISGTTLSSYNYGWLAIANVSVIELEEEVFEYTSSLSNVASISFTDEDSEPSDVFDSEKGDKNVIKSDLAIPSSYKGANGGSAEVLMGHSENEDYDATDRNEYAGLLNKDNLDAYKGCGWYSAIEALKTLNGAGNDQIWNALADKYAVQPLLIVNAAREFADMARDVYNYGYIGNNQTLGGEGYQALSVRVKVSAGAVANVYLVDTDAASRKTLSFSLPKYTFWYDDDGNILKGEPKEKASVAELKENIAYTLRSDGLYENGDGKLYANFYNLEKSFGDLDFEHDNFTYYDGEGNAVKFNDLKAGNTYYADAAKTAYAPHYLVADGTKVYKYASGVDGSATYYYMVNDAPDTDKVVYGVNTEAAALRYDNTAQNSYPYQFTIDATTDEGIAKYADKWVTVTFYLHAGSEDKTFRLELWSGYRDAKTTDGVQEGSYVMFDYSSSTLDESKFNDTIGYYTDEIIDRYKAEVGEQDKLLTSIADYEKQLTADKVAEIKKNAFGYVAEYYTYTLYDSDLYVPFNGDTAAEGETGYAYNYSDYSEKLAYLRVDDVDGENLSMSIFADYSMFDNDISLGKETTVEPDDDDTSTAGNTDNTNFWLLFSSIVLLAAILIALLVILGRDLFKKFRRGKTAGKNTYNFNKNKRYVRKYVKANGEVVNDEKADVDANVTEEKGEESEAEGEAEADGEQTPAETPTEEAPAEEKSAEETPAEEASTEEKSAEETPAEEKPADGEDKKE